MTSSTQPFRYRFIQSQLSRAAYATGLEGALLIDRLKDDGWTQLEAEFIDDLFMVIDQRDTESSYSGTLFRQKSGTGAGEGEYTLAIRGSVEMIADFVLADGLGILVEGDAGDQTKDPKQHFMGLKAAHQFASASVRVTIGRASRWRCGTSTGSPPSGITRRHSGRLVAAYDRPLVIADGPAD